MDEQRVIELLRAYADIRPAERLFTDEQAAQLRTALRSAGLAKRSEPARTLRLFPAAPVWRFVTVATAAAAALVAAWGIATMPLPGVAPKPALAFNLRADAACDPTDLFCDASVPRTRPPPGECTNFYVGVDVNEPAFVRCVYVDEQGQYDTLALDHSGTLEQRVAAGQVYHFGAYAACDEPAVTEDKSCIACLLVMAAARPLEEPAVTKAMRTMDIRVDDAGRVDCPRLAAALRQRLACEIRTVRP
jgi:hypothetical protein